MDRIFHFENTIKKVVFPYPVMLAGGVVKTIEQVRKLAPTDVIPEWGSIETEASSGNGGRDYHATYSKSGELLYSQNSRGIPNPGMAYVEQHAREAIDLFDDQGRPLILNVSGKGLDDTLSLMKRGLMCGFRAITVNGACPNKKDQPILCDDLETVSELFAQADEEIGETETVFFWKVSCGMRRPALLHNKMCVAESKTFSGIITGNTVPNTLGYRDDGSTTILTEKNALNRGGMGGPAIMPIALDHTEFCASNMSKVVIGCGGIMDATDVLKFFRAGATMVQLNSAYTEAHEDPDFIQSLLMQLYEMNPE